MSAFTTVRTMLGHQPRASWESRPHAAVVATKVIILTALAAAVVIPILTVVATSLTSEQELIDSGGWVLWPSDPTLDAYTKVLRGGVVTHATLISLGVTVVGTAVSLAVTILMAYGMSRPGMFGGRPLTILVLLTMFFSPGMIPTYLVVQELGLLDTLAALIVPVLVSAFNLIVLRGFFQGIPAELFEAARMDGAGELGILFRIALPLSAGAVAVVGLFYAVTYWNMFFNAILYLNDSGKWPLQVILRQYVLEGSPLAESTFDTVDATSSRSIQMAVVVLAMIPILVIFPFVQRHFSKGVLTGAIKS